MLVYGDAVRRETAKEKLDRIRHYLDEAARGQPWIVGHGWLVAAVVEAGELAQGIADRAFKARGRYDERSIELEQAMELVLALARQVGRSWSGYECHSDGALSALARLDEIASGEALTIKLPEGFAHYALYPESYFEAASPLAGRTMDVVGVRSIGTTLAAMVAAAIGTPCPETVRPTGHPFDRQLAFAGGERLGLRPNAELAIVDEGPGLSGSSIVAVAKAAAAQGVTPDHIHVFPSHGNGPGPKASVEAQHFWNTARTHVRSFDDLAFGSDDRRHVASWVTDLIGEPTGAIRDISGGVWRGLRPGDPADWPPVHPWQERRKFLVETASGTWLLKFAGLGRTGLEKFALAQALGAAGFSPPPLAFRHGFIVERWQDNATSLDPFGPGRARFLARLGQYLGFRARSVPVGPDRGASAGQLFEMLRVNAEEEFGPNGAHGLDAWRPCLPGLDADARRVATDNRLHAWEWLVLPGGDILKTDAVDHHVAHDLVGSQDIAWDVAGASAEFALSADEQLDVIELIERESGVGVSRQHVRFMTLSYPAFQLGYYREAIGSTADRSEAARLRTSAERYAAILLRNLENDSELDAPEAG